MILKEEICRKERSLQDKMHRKEVNPQETILKTEMILKEEICRKERSLQDKMRLDKRHLKEMSLQGKTHKDKMRHKERNLQEKIRIQEIHLLTIIHLLQEEKTEDPNKVF